MESTSTHPAAETAAMSLQEDHTELMKLIAGEPGVAEVAEVMKRYDAPPYALFREEVLTICLASGANH